MKVVGMWIGVLVLAVVGIAPAIGQVSITDGSGVYTQDFNTLEYTPDDRYVTWTNNVSLPGWYASAPDNRYRIVYNKSGESMYSYGLTGDPERALGSVVNSNTSAVVVFGVLLRNDTGSDIVALEVEYTGEQWRYGQADGLDYLFFHYKTAPESIALTDAGYTEIEALMFTSPIDKAGNSPLNGNLPENRTTIKHRFDVAIPKSHYVMLRWRNGRTLTGAHGMAVDDLSVSWEIPPPGTVFSIR